MQGAAADAPRKVFQQCLSLGITNAEETQELIDMIESRNLTTHTYNIDLANDVAADIQQYYALIHALIIKLLPSNIKR